MPPPSAVRSHFPAKTAFGRDLEASTTAYLTAHPEAPGDAARRHLKTLVILAWFAASWATLVLFASTPLFALAAAVSLAVAIAGIAMTVQQDVNHGAYARRGRWNQVLGTIIDLSGISSFIRRPPAGGAPGSFADAVDLGSLARTSPAQRRRPWHRFQHLYVWALYGFFLPKQAFYDDFVVLRQRLAGTHALPRPDVGTLVTFGFSKLFLVGWTLVIPALYHPMALVLLANAVVVFAVGSTLGTVYQLVEGAKTPPREASAHPAWSTRRASHLPPPPPTSRLVPARSLGCSARPTTPTTRPASAVPRGTGGA